MRPFAITALGGSCLLLSSCFWGLMGGDIEITNKTDDEIRANVNGAVDDGDYYRTATTIKKGKTEHFGLSSFSFSPDIHIVYRGVTKRFTATLNFFGHDHIVVRSDDFTVSN